MSKRDIDVYAYICIYMNANTLSTIQTFDNDCLAYHSWRNNVVTAFGIIFVFDYLWGGYN